MPHHCESDFVGGILPSRMAPMKIPIRRVRGSVLIGFDRGIAFNFFKGDCICVFESSCSGHILSAHHEAAESLHLCFEKIMVQQERALFKLVSINWWCSCEDSAHEAWFDDGFRIIANALACCCMSKLDVAVAFRIVFIVNVGCCTVCGVHDNVVDSCCGSRWEGVTRQMRISKACEWVFGW